MGVPAVPLEVGEEGFDVVVGRGPFIVEIAERAEPGSVILAMLPDTGERYLSTPLFEGFGADMNEEEVAIMRSTPGYHMP